MMSAHTFLKSIWPSTGHYVIATPFRIPDTDVTVYAQKVFDTAADAATFALREVQKDVFFGVHSLKERRVWNENKTNKKTGEKGAYEIRTQSNMSHARAFFFDLDVGEGTKKFNSQVDALTGLKAFCKRHALPKPTLVSSGGGIHAYWVMSDDIPSTEWVATAQRLKDVAEIEGLKIDPSRTTDVSSVLRVAGTRNHKGGTSRPVLVLQEGAVTDVAVFTKLTQDAAVRAGVKETKSVSKSIFGDQKLAEGKGIFSKNNVAEDTPEFKPVTLRAVATTCAQMKRLLLSKGDVSEPEWYYGLLNVVRFVENGDKLVYKVSEGHPDYSPAQTDEKVAQLVAKDMGPSTCETIARHCGADLCAACPYSGRVRSPLVAARMNDHAPAPKVPSAVADPTSTTIELPGPPEPFIRLKSGGLARKIETPDGDTIDVKFLDYDLYPLRRLVDRVEQSETQVWRAEIPRSGNVDFNIEADALYDRRKFVVTIANAGIYPDPNHMQSLQDYMVAYIRQLQKVADASTQSKHLGWTEELDAFVLPDKVLVHGGKVRLASLTKTVDSGVQMVHKKGTLEGQVNAMKFYDHPSYLPNQFMVGASLASMIFYATGNYGAIVNASGDSGASKSTTVYTAASLWGQPEMYVMDGTQTGSSLKGRMMRLQVLANLPTCIDEITHMTTTDASALAMGVTQPGGGPGFLQRDRTFRAESDTYRASIALTTANSSLHDALSLNNSAGTAGSMRVLELRFKAQSVHKKYQADEFLLGVKANYGHIGELFARFVVDNREAVEDEVRQMMKLVDVRARVEPKERYWSSTIACVVVACKIAHELGLLPYDWERLLNWCINTLLPNMRNVVQNEYTTPIGVLADYLERINGHILITDRETVGAKSYTKVAHEPRGELSAHYDKTAGVMYVLKQPFKEYCQKIGWSQSRIMSELSSATMDDQGNATRVVTNTNVRRTLGIGTDYRKIQAYCFLIDMSHPEVTGVIENPEVAARKASGSEDNVMAMRK